MRSPIPLLVPLLFALAPAAYAALDSAAADPRIKDLLTELGKAQRIDQVELSPDGHRLAWVRRHDGHNAIELADAAGKNVHEVALGNDCDGSALAWSPSSAELAFIADCKGKGDAAAHDKNLSVLNVDTAGAAPRKLAALNGYAHALEWSSDGKRLAFLYVEGSNRRASATAAAAPSLGEIGVDGVVSQRIATVAEQGGAIEQVSPESLHVYEYSWSPDGRRFAYTAAPPPGDNNWWVSNLYTQETRAGIEPIVVVTPSDVSGSTLGLQMAVPRFSPDGSRIAFIGGLMSDQGATGGDIYSVATDAHAKPINLTAGTHVTPVWLSWTGADQLLVSQISNGQSQVASYAVSTDAAKLTHTYFNLPASITSGDLAMSLSLSRDGKQLAFVQSDYAHAPEVHAGALSDRAPQAVTAVNVALKPSWGKAESVEWNNEGFHVQGWLLYPANYDPSKSYPMIVTVHGGPSSAVTPRWPGVGFGGVPFSALGYFVFMPNPRGSYGQGEAYTQANRKDFGYGDLRDVLAGVDAIEKKLPVDDKRLGLTGWSYGGFMTMFSVTQTQRFHAAVAGAGISNWQSYYGQNLIDQWMIPFFGASVYDNPQVYAKSSAINFIKQVKTPTLIVVGERDAECPAPQSFEFWHALRAQHVPTSLVVYEGEGHGFVKPEHQRDVLQRSLNWFGKYLPAN
ncbi:MAG TPA: S9 family peptidase [Dyella sp.]|uniref:S9 family peptidase n=1 Tax=Dyella sp. TaxID=1869338 RepID=UPI002F9541F4